jgi:hypothetical protein
MRAKRAVIVSICRRRPKGAMTEAVGTFAIDLIINNTNKILEKLEKKGKKKKSNIKEMSFHF